MSSVNNNVIPRSKGWFSLDRENVTRALLSTAMAALARKYLVQTDSKVLDVANLATVPVFLAYEKLDDEVFKVTGQRYLSGAFSVACLAAVVGATFMELESKELLLYGGVCGAIVLVADSFSRESHSYLSKI